MKPEFILLHVVDPLLQTFLPKKMNSDRARAIMLAIGFQESEFKARFQIGGPARGYWQFERMGGVFGVLTHPATREYVPNILRAYDLPPNSDPIQCHSLIGYHDLLAATFARLLLWTHPAKLPSPAETEIAWEYYLECWRPGKPHPDKWEGNWNQAWDIVNNNQQQSIPQ